MTARWAFFRRFVRFVRMYSLRARRGGRSERGYGRTGGGLRTPRTPPPLLPPSAIRTANFSAEKFFGRKILGRIFFGRKKFGRIVSWGGLGGRSRPNHFKKFAKANFFKWCRGGVWGGLPPQETPLPVPCPPGGVWGALPPRNLQ